MRALIRLFALATSVLACVPAIGQGWRCLEFPLVAETYVNARGINNLDEVVATAAVAPGSLETRALQRHPAERQLQPGPGAERCRRSRRGVMLLLTSRRRLPGLPLARRRADRSERDRAPDLPGGVRPAGRHQRPRRHHRQLRTGARAVRAELKRPMQAPGRHALGRHAPASRRSLST